MIGIGVIGYGYWGPQIVRNFHSLNGARVPVVCDKETEVLKRAKQAYADLEVTTDLSRVLTSPHVDAVAVVTPVWTHFELEKPLWRMASTFLWRSRSQPHPIKRGN